MALVNHPPSPAFGTADLTNCEREQIHLAASIQPHGALLVLNEADYTIVQASANAAVFLGFASHLVGTPLQNLGGTVWERIRPYFDTRIETIPVAIKCHLGDASKPYNMLLHHLTGGGLILEFERAGPPVDFSKPLERALRTVLAASSLQALCDQSAAIFTEITGYDRVMIYRFDDAGHGEVFSETKKPELEAFLGNRYPASDIPQIARRLYERNRVRMLADLDYTPSPLVPRLSPISGGDLDMSLCFLRSVSPIHVQYLKNMGVSATLVVSLMVGGKLWGLISCHHYTPRCLHFEMRAICELMAEIISTRITALESFVRGQGELSVRRLEQRMAEIISRNGDWRSALFDSPALLLQPLNATGAALIYEGQITTTGEVPGTEQIRNISQWLQSRLHDGVLATASLGFDEPSFAPLTSIASGTIATRVSGEPGEMLIWFRKERLQTITWAGNPYKHMTIGDNPLDLSPRRSFAQWHQVVEGTSDPWTAADLAAARLIGVSVTDVILQFRSVRILIAQDQLEQVLRQVRSSDQQVVVADASGHVIETNIAFDAMRQSDEKGLQHLDELPSYFADPSDIAHKLNALMQTGQAFRSELILETAQGGRVPLLVRAESVVSPFQRVLGYVFTFTDLTERKAAESARKRFQDGVHESHHQLATRLYSPTDLMFQTLMSTVIENAQLAALEITYGTDTAGMPDLLEGVRSSVARTAEVLEHLSVDAREITP